MAVNKHINPVDIPSGKQNTFKSPDANVTNNMVKCYSATFNVHVDKDGYLCAADMDQGIFTDGKDREELIENIHEAVECHFDVPFEQVNIKILGLI